MAYTMVYLNRKCF